MGRNPYGNEKCVYNAEFKASHRVHWNAFQNIYRNQRDNGVEVSPELSRDDKGFRRFVEVIGQIPIGMYRPSVSRFDHSKGYIFDSENNRWNFRWESMWENGFEAVMRCNLVENTSSAKKFKALEECLKGLPSGCYDLKVLATKLQYSRIGTIEKGIIKLVERGSINARVGPYQVFIQ